MEKISNFFLLCDLFIVVLVVFALGLSHEVVKKGDNLKILNSSVQAIGVIDKNTYGTVNFTIYLIPKKEFPVDADLVISYDNVSLGNSFQDYTKNLLTCLNRITKNRLKNYVIFIKAKSKFQDVDGGSGSIMLGLGILSALYNKTIDPKIIATGTVNADCSIGSIMGIREKLIGVENLGYKKFYVPYSNYALIKDINTTVKIIPVKNFEDVINGELK